MLILTVTIIIFIASFVFAMLGLGGGMVYVPILKWAGFPVKEVAIPMGLLLNGLNTLLALIPFSRKKLVDWKGGMAMAVSALLFSPVGAFTSKYLPEKPLLILFAISVMVAAIRTIMVSNKADSTEIMDLKKRSIIGVLVGAFAGFMGGLLGIGGGFIIAPILMWMGYETKKAAATTAFVVTFSSFSGYLGHSGNLEAGFTLTAILVIAVILASQLGAGFMVSKAKPKIIKKVYATVLFGIAIKLIWGVF